jgi:tetratricopeptide (TPR) repeat protein
MISHRAARARVVAAPRFAWLRPVLALAALAGLAVARPAAAAPPGSSAAAESLALCGRADDLSGDARTQALARGMALAEGALAVDQRDALAHFAVACNLGKQMKEAGIGLGQLVSLRRLKREFDATLDLAPGDADALTAKGALLLRLPRLLGGDTEEAEQLLRRAVAAEPDNDQARCYLAEALSARGAAAEAQALMPHC